MNDVTDHPTNQNLVKTSYGNYSSMPDQDNFLGLIIGMVTKLGITEQPVYLNVSQP